MRKSEGCVTVEYGSGSFFAVAKFRNVKLGQILYGGDDLSAVKWDGRNWHDRTEIRKNLFAILCSAVMLALQLPAYHIL
jgi:hypothetical protein